MRKHVVVAVTAAVALAAAAGVAAATHRASHKIVVPLRMVNNSGQTGTATIAGNATKYEVTIVVRGKSRVPGNEFQYAHLHTGTCADYAKLKTMSQELASVALQLYNVTSGRSTTDVYGDIPTIADGRHSINVHEQNSP